MTRNLVAKVTLGNMAILIRNRLSRLMGERRLSIQDVARGAGLSYPVVSGLYHDRATRLDIATLDKLCTFFRVQPGDILEWVPPEQQQS